MRRVASVLLAAGCTASTAVSDPTTDLVERHTRALSQAAAATDPDALHAGLAHAYTGAELTRQVRARAATMRDRATRGAQLDLTEVVHERSRWLSGTTDSAAVELHWRLVGTVTHAGHTHPRHLRTAALIDAVRTDDGWRIRGEQPVEVLAMP